MDITLCGPSNPWWLSTAVGVGLAAIMLTWRAWWMLAKVIVAGYLCAWRVLGRL